MDITQKLNFILENGHSQESVAAEVGISQAGISKIAAGKIKTSVRHDTGVKLDRMYRRVVRKHRVSPPAT